MSVRAERIYKSAAATADGQLATGKGILVGFLLRSGSDAAQADFYDGTNTGGRYLGSATVGAANTAALVELPGAGTPFDTGLYVDLTGTSPKTVAYFD